MFNWVGRLIYRISGREAKDVKEYVQSLHEEYNRVVEQLEEEQNKPAEDLMHPYWQFICHGEQSAIKVSWPPNMGEKEGREFGKMSRSLVHGKFNQNMMAVMEDILGQNDIAGPFVLGFAEEFESTKEVDDEEILIHPSQVFRTEQ